MNVTALAPSAKSCPWLLTAWEGLRKGRTVEREVAQIIYNFMSGNGGRVSRGKKKIVTTDTAKLSLADLQKYYGLLATEEMVWHEAMDKIPPPDRAYITALLRRGEKFNAKARIKLSTIHGTKRGRSTKRGALSGSYSSRFKVSRR